MPSESNAQPLSITEIDSQPALASAIGRYRWVICALLFFATTVNYLDRSVLSVLAPTLRNDLHWTDQEYGYIASAFSLAYAIGFLFAGWVIDRIGTRIGYTAYLIAWSLAAAGHAFASGAMSFAVARFALGLGESGNFPGAARTVAEWFPKKERAFATGVFNAGSNVGAILAPLLVPWLALNWGWQSAFVITGLIGLVWVAFWVPVYRRPSEHPKLSKEELEYISSDPADPSGSIPWLRLIPHRQTIAFAMGKLLTDSIWWFYLFWFPMFMKDQFAVDLKSIGLPMVVVYVLADVGSIAGGWLSTFFISRGFSLNKARKSAMLACALAIIPVVMAPHVEGKWVAVFLVGAATAGHQGFSANLMTLPSDLFPRRAVASVFGIGGFAGAISGFFINLGTGWLKQHTGSYAIMFALAGCAYITALAVIQLLVPRLQPAKIG